MGVLPRYHNETPVFARLALITREGHFSPHAGQASSF
jgi:hypothetical protein